MYIDGRYSLIMVFVGIVFLTFGSIDNAYAIDYVLSDEASCTGAPIGGTWDGLTSTCSKTSNLSILAGDTLTISNGITLEFTTNNDLVNRGGITNNGIVNSTMGGDIINRNSATFSNSGIIALNSTLAGTGILVNRNDATFTNTGTISLDGSNSDDGQLRNQNNGDFFNSGIISIEGTSASSGRILNRGDADFTNSGTITIEGTSNGSGRLLNKNTADFTNTGAVTITGTDNSSGQLRNENSASITNSGTITIVGINTNSGLVRNLSVLTNSGTFSTNNNFDNNDADSVLTNSGTIIITLELDNTGGSIINQCTDISFGSFVGNLIVEEPCNVSSSSTAYEDPTIGKSHDGRQMVENGICIDEECWTVTAAFHQDFELVEMLTDSTHTISTTVFCQNGVSRCNYVAYGVSPYGTNINDSVWKVIMQKDHLDNWSMDVVDPDEYLGEVTSTTQIVDNQFLTASATMEFKKPTPGMILNVEVRDSKGGYRDFKFNDGIAIVDSYAYPLVEASYDSPLEIEPLCLYENPDKRYTCAFEKIREQTIIDAQVVYDDVINKKR